MNRVDFENRTFFSLDVFDPFQVNPVFLSSSSQKMSDQRSLSSNHSLDFGSIPVFCSDVSAGNS